MLQLTITAQEFFNEETQEFIQIKPVTIQMEHSLVSISKWEAKWHKPFLTEDNKTDEELVDYLRCMTITQNVNPYAYYAVIWDKGINAVEDVATTDLISIDGVTDLTAYAPVITYDSDNNPGGNVLEITHTSL